MPHVGVDDGATIRLHGGLVRERAMGLGNTEFLPVKGSLADGEVKVVQEIECRDLFLRSRGLEPSYDEVDAVVSVEVEREVAAWPGLDVVDLNRDLILVSARSG